MKYARINDRPAIEAQAAAIGDKVMTKAEQIYVTASALVVKLNELSISDDDRLGPEYDALVEALVLPDDACQAGGCGDCDTCNEHNRKALEDKP
jgi:hypothetical protein